jgi:hypothetical protein
VDLVVVVIIVDGDMVLIRLAAMEIIGESECSTTKAERKANIRTVSRSIQIRRPGEGKGGTPQFASVSKQKNCGRRHL